MIANFKHNLAYLWQQCSPALRWFVLIAYIIAFLILLLTAGPLIAVGGVVLGTAAMLGLLAMLAVYLMMLLGVPFFLFGVALNSLRSRDWLWAALLFLATAGWYFTMKAIGCSHWFLSDSDFALYASIAFGWCVILAALLLTRFGKIKPEKSDLSLV